MGSREALVSAAFTKFHVSKNGHMVGGLGSTTGNASD